jgi:hypothetical protein
METAQMKVEKLSNDVLNHLDTAVPKSRSALTDATAASASRLEGDTAVPYQQRHIDLAAKRMELLELVAKCHNAEQLLIAPKDGDQNIMFVHQLGKGLQNVEDYIKKESDAEGALPAAEVLERVGFQVVNLPAMPDGTHEALLKSLLCSYGFQETSFQRSPCCYTKMGKDLMKLSHCLHDKAALTSWVVARKTTGQPLPIVDAEQLMARGTMELQTMRICLLSTEHSLKEFLAEIKGAFDNWKKLIGMVDKGIKQVVENITEHDKTEAKKKSKEASDLKKNQEREETKKKRDEDKRMRKEVQDTQMDPQTESFLLSSSEPGLVDIKAFDDPAQFVRSKKEGDGDFVAGEPYVVKKYEALANQTEDRAVKSQTGLFRIQFAGQSGLPGHKGFGQTSYMGDAKGKLQELLIDLAATFKFRVTTDDTILSRVFDTVYLYGNTANSQNLDLERQGFGQMRFQLQGEKAFAIIKYNVVDQLAAESFTMPANPGENIFDYHRRIIGNINSEALKLLDSKGLQIYRGTLKPGNYLYVPAGCYFLEKSMGPSMNIGFRCAHFDVRQKAMESFSALQAGVTTVSPDQPLVKVWAKIAPCLPAAPA